MARLVYATRKSALALAQCRSFIARVVEANPGLDVGEELIVTSGDRIQDRPLSEVGGKGLFVKEIEEALLAKRANIAVHSIKDVPGVLPDGLELVCIPRREDPRDVLVSPRHGTLAALPPNATVGTSSLRRAVALARIRPDLTIVPLRGNVDTRLRKVDEGACDAIVLARAGLVRLGLEGRATETFEPSQMCPAVGQGALGIEARSDDAEARAILAPLHDVESAIAVAAERGVMIAVEGDCRTPIGAFARRGPDGSLELQAFLAQPDGTRFRSASSRNPWPTRETEAAALGRALGVELLAQNP